MSDEPRYIWTLPDGIRAARPITPEEQACDCGCQDVERGPLGDLTYYPEADPVLPAEAGVSTGWLIINDRHPEPEPVAFLTMGDGKGTITRRPE